MLPYIRLGYVSDPSEMQSVISSQGPICPVSSFHLDLRFFAFSCYSGREDMHRDFENLIKSNKHMNGSI